MRDGVKAGCWYAALLAALFHRLFLGEVLCGGADRFQWGPFRPYAPAEWRAYSHSMGGDLWHQHGPWQAFQRAGFQAGKLPTWNPHAYLGAPFHANGQIAMLYPFNWPYFFGDSETVRGPQTAVRLWVAALAMFLLLRRWGCGFGPAFAAGAAWMCAAYPTKWLLWPLGNLALWLPALTLAFDAWLVRPTPRRFAAMMLAGTVLQLGGHPETQFQGGFAALGVAAARTLALGIGFRRGLLRWLACAAALALGAAGAGAQLLPFLCQLPDSLDWQERLHNFAGGHEGRKAWLFVQPCRFGTNRGWSTYAPGNFIEDGLAFGGLALAGAFAAALAALRGNHAGPWPRRAVLALAGFEAFGTGILFDTPLAEAVRKLPVFNQVGVARWALLVGFVGVLLGALGWEHARRDRGVRRLLAGLATLVAVLAAAALVPHGPSSFDRLPEALGDRLPWRVAALHSAVRALAAALAVAAGAVALWLGRFRWAWLCVLAECAIAAWDMNVTAPRELAVPPAPPLLTQLIAAAGPGRVVAAEEDLAPNQSVQYGFRDVRGYDWPLPARLAKAYRRLGWRLPGMVRMPAGKAWPHGDAELAAFLRRSAVNVFFADRRADAWLVGAERWPLAGSTSEFEAYYARAEALPRVRLEAWRPATADEAFAQLFAPAGPAAVEEPPAGARSPPAANGKIDLLRDDGERVEIETDSPTGGLATLADRWDRGWSATIDGIAATPFRVDFLFRGVLVEPGRHRIVWEYQAPGLRAGWAMTAAVLAAAAVLAVWRTSSAGGRGAAGKNSESPNSP